MRSYSFFVGCYVFPCVIGNKLRYFFNFDNGDMAWTKMIVGCGVGKLGGLRFTVVSESTRIGVANLRLMNCLLLLYAAYTTHEDIGVSMEEKRPLSRLGRTMRACK